MRITELTLFSKDIQNQKQFYRSVFSKKILEESETHFTIQIGWTRLTFLHSSESYLYHYCYMIPSNKLEGAIQWLEGKVNLIKTDGSVIHDHIHWNAKAIYFYDGNGNIGEFIVRYNLDNSSDGEFTSDDILCINEIGAPSNSPSNLHSFLEENIGTTIWKGDLERFAANGDQEGMFLLVNNEIKKTWYPTEKFPQSSPFDVQIIHNDQKFNLTFDGSKFINC